MIRHAKKSIWFSAMQITLRLLLAGMIWGLCFGLVKIAVRIGIEDRYAMAGFGALCSGLLLVLDRRLRRELA